MSEHSIFVQTNSQKEEEQTKSLKEVKGMRARKRARKLTLDIEVLAAHASCFHLPQILVHAKLCRAKTGDGSVRFLVTTRMYSKRNLLES